MNGACLCVTFVCTYVCTCALIHNICIDICVQVHTHTQLSRTRTHAHTHTHTHTLSLSHTHTQETQDATQRATCLLDLGSIYLHSGRLSLAQDFLRRAQAANYSNCDSYQHATASFLLGRALRLQGAVRSEFAPHLIQARHRMRQLLQLAELDENKALERGSLVLLWSWSAQEPLLNFQAHKIKAQAVRLGSDLRSLFGAQEVGEHEGILRKTLLISAVRSWKRAMGELMVRGGYKVLTRLQGSGEEAQEASVLLLLATTQIYIKPDLPEALALASRSADMFAALACPWGQANALVARAQALCGQRLEQKAIEALCTALPLLGEPPVRPRGDVKDAANFAVALMARGGALRVTCEALWTMGFVYKAVGQAELSLVGWQS